MEVFLYCLLFSALMSGIKLFDYCQKSHRSQNIFKKVGWIVEREHPMSCYSEMVRLRDEELIYYVLQEQTKMDLQKEFFLDYSNEAERMYAEKILNYHKEYVVKFYFSDFLMKNKNICKLNSLEYYMFSLYMYLNNNADTNAFHGEIYKFEKSEKPYSYYTLTDFGRAFYKIYLITLIFTESNEKTKKLFKYIDPNFKNHIMDYLKKNEVSFVRL